MADSSASLTADRIIFLDKIRYTLVLGVVLLHAACAYAPIIVWWSVRDLDGTRLFDLLIVILDIFLMPGLFFLAGYFALSSLAKRQGSGQFILAKLKRLGIPLVLVGLFWVPIISYLRYLEDNGVDHSYLSFWWMQMQTVLDFHWVSFVSQEVAIQHINDFSLWHLWFISLLLIFFILTAMVNLLSLNRFQITPSGGALSSLSIIRAMIIAAIAGALGFALVNRFVPSWGWGKIGGFLLIQPTRIPIYIVAYVLGIHSFRHAWFKQQFPGKAWLWLAACLVLTWGLLMVLKSIQMSIMLTPWSQALEHGFLRSFAYLAFLGFFLCTAQRFGNQPSLLWRHLHPISYDIYLIHLPLVVIIQWLLYPVSLPIFWKFAITFLSSLMLCWFLGRYILAGIVSRAGSFLSWR